MRVTCEERMKNGGTALNRGQRIRAMGHFHKATRLDPFRSDAWQLLGVCLRVLGFLLFADAAFGKAYFLAPTGGARGKVLRDWSQVALARKHYKFALHQLNMAKELLASQGSPLRDEAFHEYWVTIAYIGDVHRKQGDKIQARAILRQACMNLLDHSPYGLNALMRYLASLPWWERWYIGHLVIELARVEKNRKRVRQIRILQISVGLHDFLF